MAQGGMFHSIVLLRPDGQLNLALRTHDYPSDEGRNPERSTLFEMWGYFVELVLFRFRPMYRWTAALS